MIQPEIREKLEKQQYRLVGAHSAVKVCHWTKRSLVNEGVCYKETFYGIPCHRCVQMTPALVCPNSCLYCWREMKGLVGSKLAKTDDPKTIINGCIGQQRILINGFPGNPKVNKQKFKEAQNPKLFAISLSGEPTVYSRLGELIEELHRKTIWSFLVTNGQFPEALEKLDILPTQLYVSLDAPNKKVYKAIDRPSLPDYWERLNRTLELLPSLNTRTVLRITAVRGLNMLDLEGYACLIKKADPMFIEVKGYMFIGESRKHLQESNMPLHSDILDFAEKLADLTDLRIIDQKPESRVALLAEKDYRNRKLS